MQGLVSKRGQHRQGIIRSKGKRVDVLPSKNKAGQTTPLLTYRMSHSGRELQGQGRSDPGESISGEGPVRPHGIIILGLVKCVRAF